MRTLLIALCLCSLTMACNKGPEAPVAKSEPAPQAPVTPAPQDPVFTPYVEDLAPSPLVEPRETPLPADRLSRVTLFDVQRAWGINGRLECRVREINP